MPYGPCQLCGRTNYPNSLGGPSICPECDCGHPPVPMRLSTSYVFQELSPTLMLGTPTLALEPLAAIEETVMEEKPLNYVVKVFMRTEWLYVDGEGELVDEQRNAQRMTRAKAVEEAAEWGGTSSVKVVKLVPGRKRKVRLDLVEAGKAWLQWNTFPPPEAAAVVGHAALVTTLKAFIEQEAP